MGRDNPGWTFLNNNLPKEEEETESVELAKDERIVDLERLLKLEKDKSRIVSKFILIIFTTSNFTNLFINYITGKERSSDIHRSNDEYTDNN